MSHGIPRPLAWRIPGFRQLAVAWVFTNLGDSALYLMAAVWVKDMTGSDAAAASVFIALGLPAIAAPFLGAWADRVSRKRLLTFANACMVPIVLCLLLVAPTGQFWLVYAVILVYGAVGYLTAAAQSGLIRDLVDDESLASANGVLTTIDQGFRLISPLIGTALYVFAGPGAVVVLTASCFAITAVQIARVRVVESEPEVRTGTSRYWHEVGAGFAHLARTPLLNRVTLALTIAFGAVGLVNVAIFPALEQGLKVDTAVLGILVPVQGVGALVGGILSARIVTALGEARAVGLGLALVALGCVPAVFTSLAGVVAGMAVLGFGIPVIVVGFATLRQRRTPATLQGRTAAAGNVAINVPQTLASVFGVALISVVDYRVLVLATVVTVLAAAVIAAAGRRAIVDIEAPAGS